MRRVEKRKEKENKKKMAGDGGECVVMKDFWYRVMLQAGTNIPLVPSELPGTNSISL
jgi:hypothetical protein